MSYMEAAIVITITQESSVPYLVYRIPRQILTLTLSMITHSPGTNFRGNFQFLQNKNGDFGTLYCNRDVEIFPLTHHSAVSPLPAMSTKQAWKPVPGRVVWCGVVLSRVLRFLYTTLYYTTLLEYLSLIHI